MPQNLRPIVVVGSINIDLVARVQRIPRAGETLLGSDFQLHPGGKGANQAAAVAKLSCPVTLLGKVGDDIFGARLLDTLRKHGVNTSEITVEKGSSGTASIAVDEHGENTVIVTPAANYLVSPEYIESKAYLLRQAGMVLAQLEIPLAAIDRLAELCEQSDVPLMLDPAPAQQLKDSTLRRVSWFTPNETEAQFYAPGAASCAETVEELFRLGVRGVVLKRGAAGATLAQPGGIRHETAPVLVEAVDTTAAGDAFNAAFAVGLVSGKTPIESIEYAAVAAAISVTRQGAEPSMPTRSEVESFLSSRLG